MAHRLQLSLVAAAKEVYWVHEFFRNLSFIITAVTGSCKRQDQLEAAEAAKIAIQLAAGEIETGKGANQVSTLQRPCDTRWSSHLRSISNLIKLYGSTCKVLENVQMTELGSRFNDRVVELLKLSSSLNPRDGFKTFDIDAICKLAREYYPLDFSDDDIDTLKFQLKMFQVNIPNYPSLEKLSSIADLCKELASTRLGKEYSLIDRLIRLLLTLPVSTATGERAFSAMKIVKNRLRNKMNDDFLADSLVIFIERMIAKNFRLDDILSDFVDLKERRVLFK
ncbi:unnamed protein product [Linum tenue]|uniref:HAT C-terminal dimerisation domain-containing protein n=1 Tax=Linum tenue TaxID=586396 RepID=A0AAV0LNI0_9ROSI|nr:unnamed protein product [Linum tenue]